MKFYSKSGAIPEESSRRSRILKHVPKFSSPKWTTLEWLQFILITLIFISLVAILTLIIVVVVKLNIVYDKAANAITANPMSEIMRKLIPSANNHDHD